MSKIYDALQIAHGERLAATKDVSDEPIISSPPPLTGYSPSVLPRYYEEADLLALAQNIAARLPNPDQNVIQFIGSRMGEGTSTLIREFALTAAKHSSKPVLLIEADFHQPSQNQAFAIETKPRFLLRFSGLLPTVAFSVLLICGKQPANSSRSFSSIPRRQLSRLIACLFVKLLTGLF